MSAITIQDEAEFELSAEAASLIAYRQEQFERMGFGSALAQLMAERPPTSADPGVDLGLARQLMARGCSVPLAERILL